MVFLLSSLIGEMCIWLNNVDLFCDGSSGPLKCNSAAAEHFSCCVEEVYGRGTKSVNVFYVNVTSRGLKDEEDAYFTDQITAELLT